MADTAYLSGEGDTLDYICWRFYGQQSGAVESVLSVNPGLADLGPVLPLNTRVVLPDLSRPAQEVQPIRLWG